MAGRGSRGSEVPEVLQVKAATMSVAHPSLHHPGQKRSEVCELCSSGPKVDGAVHAVQFGAGGRPS